MLWLIRSDYPRTKGRPKQTARVERSRPPRNAHLSRCIVCVSSFLWFDSRHAHSSNPFIVSSLLFSFYSRLYFDSCISSASLDARIQSRSFLALKEGPYYSYFKERRRERNSKKYKFYLGICAGALCAPQTYISSLCSLATYTHMQQSFSVVRPFLLPKNSFWTENYGPFNK